MDTKISTKNGFSSLSYNTDFNEVLDKNFVVICEAIATKGKILKELSDLWERECDCDKIISPIMHNATSEKEAIQLLIEKLQISQISANYIFNMSLESYLYFNAMNMEKHLEDYNTNIRKLIV